MNDVALDPADNDEPVLSFVIPYYANLGYLDQAIRSVRAQTVSEWELVVVDDAGPEDASELLRQFDDPRIRYHRNATRQGLPGNWNTSVSHARADLVTLVHADDRLLPTYAERMVEAARSHPNAAAYFCDVRIIDVAGRPTSTAADRLKAGLTRRQRRASEISGDRGLASLLRANFIYCPTLLIRRDVVGTAPFDVSWKFVADWAFTTSQLVRGRTLVSVDEPLLEYRRHSAQTTAAMTSDAQRFTEELAFLEEMRHHAQACHLRRSSRAARWRLITRAHVALSATADLVRGRLQPARLKAMALLGDLRRSS